jgi:hypothetical protein
MTQKRIIAGLIALAILAAFYLGSVALTGTSPGLFLPVFVFAGAWMLGNTISEGIALKDREKWWRTVATVVGVTAAVLGMGFLVVTVPFESPLQFAARGLVELGFSAGAAFTALAIRNGNS